MYSYSPIETLLVKNFRNIGQVEIDFNDSPIVAFVGDNDCGKTSVSKAFTVCALHANPRDQKDYIRDGTNGFGVAIKLQDGSIISRIKTETMNRYQVDYPDGRIWETNKIDGGLPVQVTELMGLIEEPETKEFLHIRTYEDQLLFVVTPASTNYKVMYDALKVDQITRAIRVGNTQANDLKATIARNEISVEALTNNLRGMRVVDIEPLVNIKERLVKHLEVLKKLKRAKEILDRIDSCTKQLGSLELIHSNNIKEINVVEATKLNEINRLLNNRNRLDNLLAINSKVEALEEIKLDQVARLNSVMEKSEELSRKISSAKALVQLSDLKEIDEYSARQLNRAYSLLESVNNKEKELSRLRIDECKLIEQKDFDQVVKLNRIEQLLERNKLLDTEATKSETYVKQVKDYFKACGARVVTCDKCGEQMVIDEQAQ